MRVFAVYGASGFGREVMPLLRKQVEATNEITGFEVLFIDDGKHGSIVNGHRVVSYEEFLGIPEAEKFAVIAIANSAVRERIAAQLENDGIGSLSIFADNSVIMDEVDIETGCVLSPFVTVTSNVKIGKHFHCNIYSYVAHDCIIGDFVTFAPGVKCNGNIHVEDHAYIGTGAIIRQGLSDKPLVIGRGAVIGMGAVVTKSVPPGVTVIGNPARPLSKEGLRSAK